MNREELKSILPHREPMLLLDEAFVKDGGIAVGRYTVQGDEFFLQGHFPGEPVVPGVLLCEMMAQCCCVLLKEELRSEDAEALEDRIQPYYTGLDSVKFKNPVRPGDTVEFECKINRVLKPFYFAEGIGTAAGKQCVSAKFSFALIRK